MVATTGDSALLSGKSKENTAGGSVRWFVFPHPNDQPSGGGEASVCVAVAVSVPSDLRGPPGAIGDRGGPMRLAAVPEAAVYEDSDLGSGEDDVGCSAQTRNGHHVQPITEPKTVEVAAQQALWCRVLPRLRCHTEARLPRRSSESGECCDGVHGVVLWDLEAEACGLSPPGYGRGDVVD